MISFPAIYLTPPLHRLLYLIKVSRNFLFSLFHKVILTSSAFSPPSSLFTKLCCRVKDEKENFQQIIYLISEIMHYEEIQLSLL